MKAFQYLLLQINLRFFRDKHFFPNLSEIHKNTFNQMACQSLVTICFKYPTKLVTFREWLLIFVNVDPNRTVSTDKSFIVEHIANFLSEEELSEYSVFKLAPSNWLYATIWRKSNLLELKMLIVVATTLQSVNHILTALKCNYCWPLTGFLSF